MSATILLALKLSKAKLSKIAPTVIGMSLLMTAVAGPVVYPDRPPSLKPFQHYSGSIVWPKA